MRVNHNIPALFAHNAYSTTQASIGETIQKLSTGLRINSAADDAAGLGISEKMRSQIRGLDQAARNAQDGMSMIQTAEGALQEVHSMLQRMRELSVQAANDTLTSEDRAYIQGEIDSLKDAIDRIAGTTQFNKKRLLDGSSDALWSSDRLDVWVNVKGPLSSADQFGQVAETEGNYKISVTSLDAGQNQVLKSNILTTVLTNGKVAAAKPMTKLSDITNFLDNGINILQSPQSLSLSIDGMGDASITLYADDTIDSLRKKFIEALSIASDGISENAGVQFVGGYEKLEDFINRVRSENPDFDSGAIDGYYVTGQNAMNLTDVVKSSGAESGNPVEKWNFTEVIWPVLTEPDPSDPDYANLKDTYDRQTNILEILKKGSLEGAAQRVFDAYGLEGVGTALVIEFAPLQPWTEATGGTSGVNGRITIDDKKFTFPDDCDTFENLMAHEYVHVVTFLDPGIQSALNAVDGSGSWLVEGTTTYAAEGGSYRINVATPPPPSTPSGNPYDPNEWINKAIGEVLLEGKVGSEVTTVNRDAGYAASYLLTRYFDEQSIANGGTGLLGVFEYLQTHYDPSEHNPDASYLNEAMTLASNGLFTCNADLLGTQRDWAVHAMDTTLQSVDGTLLLHSPIAGSAGKITLSGDDRLLRALGFAEVQSAEEPVYGLTVTDAHSGVLISFGATFSGGTITGALQNIDVQIGPNFAMKVDRTGTMYNGYGTYKFVGNTDDFVVHISANSTVLQVGANEGEVLNISFGDTGARALGVHKISLLDRESAARAITVLDNAISTVSAKRARLGAYQNGLEHTVNNLTTTGTNLTAAESRIRDADMSQEMLNFTKLNILLQSGTAMMTQANQLPQAVLSLLRG